MTELYAGMFDDRYGYPGEYSLFRCPVCLQMQTVPLLSDAELPPLYGQYYPRRHIDPEALRRQVGEPSSPRHRIARWWSGTDNQGHYEAERGMAVLDYGCGVGLSLLEMQKLGAEAYGLEADPNVRQVINALNLRIHIGSIDSDPFPGVRFDLVVLNQVLEHIPAPHLLVPKLAARLKPGGRLILAFPNSSSAYARRFGRDWINWHIPYHLHHFNPKSARLFFERHGWKVLSLRTITPNLWTVLQLRAIGQRTTPGVPNPMWTGEDTGQPAQLKAAGTSRLAQLLHDFALRAHHPARRFVLAAWNRAIDACGVGDSILVAVTPRTD